MSGPAYDEAWVHLRSALRFRRIAERLLFVPLGVVALFVLGIVVFQIIPRTGVWKVAPLASFITLTGFYLGIRVVADLRVRRFRCPRCGKQFVAFRILQKSGINAIDCQYCGLTVGAVS